MHSASAFNSFSNYRCGWMNGCRWMYVNIANHMAHRLCLLLGTCLIGASVHFEVMSIGIDRRTGRFYLRPPIVHRERKQFAGAGQSCQYLTFPFDVALVAILTVAVAVAQIARMKNGCNSRENVQRAHVNATIDECRHIRARLLHIMIDRTSLWIDHQAAIVNGLLFGRLCTHYRYLCIGLLIRNRKKIMIKWIFICSAMFSPYLGLSIFRSMKFIQFLERKIGANVTVEHKKCRRIARTNLITEMIHAAGCAEHREFLQISGSSKKKNRKALINSIHFSYLHIRDNSYRMLTSYSVCMSETNFSICAAG